MAANIINPVPESRLLPTVPPFDGNDPEEQPHFIDSLEKCFALSNLSNEGKASAAVLKFPPKSPARQWYDFNIQSRRCDNCEIWLPVAAAAEVAATGTAGQPGYVAAVPAVTARDGGLKAAIQAHWPVANDLQSMLKLQLTNGQKTAERFAAWIARVQFNVLKKHTASFDNDFITGPTHKAAYKIVFETEVTAELRLKANALLQKVFEDLPTHTIASYTEAATTWERTDEGKRWLASSAPAPPKQAPRAAHTAAVRGSSSAAAKPTDDLVCDYCGIRKSHTADVCFKRKRDEEAGKFQAKVDGYPLKQYQRSKPRPQQKRRSGSAAAAQDSHTLPANHQHQHHGLPANAGPPAPPQQPQPQGNPLPALQWHGGHAAAVSGEQYPYLQRASALERYPHLAAAHNLQGD